MTTTPKIPVAPMNGRWLKKGEVIQDGDCHINTRAECRPAHNTSHGVRLLGDMPIFIDGKPYGYFRPSQANPKRKTKTVWMYHVTYYSGAWTTRVLETRKKARYARRTFEAPDSICGPIIKVEMPI